MRMRMCLSLVVVLALLACGRQPDKPAPPTADAAAKRALASGEVVGFVGPYGSHVWLGLPFAKPPVAELRWRAPRPPEPWSGTREALAFGSPCAQFASAIGGIEAEPGTVVGSEDCLYLNVYAPRFAPDEVPKPGALLPVMFWIHGGGQTIGHAGYYDGGNLAARENVIVVTTNYRLGPFGWLHHPALADAEATPLDRSGNYGTLDLVRALAWVRENAAAFGGDPERVTIFGESAGGTNVVSLLVSPLARGLFQRAVVQSGGAELTALSEAHDGKPGTEFEVTGSNAVLAALGDDPRARSAEEVLRAYPGEKPIGMFGLPTQIRDGVVLPDAEITEVLERGDYAQVPIVLGSNRDEGKLFMMGDPQLVRRWFGFLPRLRVPEERYQLMAEYGAKMWKVSGVDSLAVTLTRVQGPSVYAYRFDWDEEPTLLFSDFGVLLGAAHGFEIPFVFGHWYLGERGTAMFTKKNQPGREELSARMSSYWAQLAYAGAPGRGRKGDLPEWSAWDDSSADALKYVVFDTQSDGGVRMVSGAYTEERVVAEVLADSRLPTARDKCLQLHDLARFSDTYTEQDYGAEPTCQAFAYADYPWKE